MDRSRMPAAGVGCLVFREGRILLVRDGRGSQPGTWALIGKETAAGSPAGSLW